QFVASFGDSLSTDWYVDQAMMVPTGTKPPGPYLYSADASVGSLDPGWQSVPDGTALNTQAAKAVKGRYPTYRNDVFGGPILLGPSQYDVWYRVRVVSTSAAPGRLTLGLWDDEGTRWVGSTLL